MNLARVRQLNSHEYESGPVVYWMNRECRAQDNWALLYAQNWAIELNVPLLVVYNLVPEFLGGGRRQYDFKVRGLVEVESELRDHNIAFQLLIDQTGKQTPDIIVDFLNDTNAGMLITDFSPLKICRGWNDTLRKKVTIPMFGIDAHNIVPVWIASPKQEYGAYTLRPKLHKLLPEFLDEFPRLKKMKNSIPGEWDAAVDWNSVITLDGPDDTVAPVDWLVAGAAGGKKMLRHFLAARLETYATLRNDPLSENQSNLSPYLHYGQIAPQRVALEVIKHDGRDIQKILHIQKNAAGNGESDSTAAFIEELIVRRELADNFCFYNTEYDSVLGFPDWAQKSLSAAQSNDREYVYTKKQFEHAQTHDDLWNAAQKEMVRTGKMHGYMRMYWAKKILEWSVSATDAMKIAIYLNDKYELDGRDPNGYAGIAWSIGGVHDRAWFPRPVFGLVRYMARSGCEKKFDVDAYIQKWL